MPWCRSSCSTCNTRSPGRKSTRSSASTSGARGLPQADLAQIILYRTQGTYAQHLGEIEQVCQRWLRRMDVCWYELATVYQMQGNAEKQKALLD